MFPVGTGSIDVGTGGEKNLDYLLDAGAVIDVMWVPTAAVPAVSNIGLSL